MERGAGISTHFIEAVVGAAVNMLGSFLDCLNTPHQQFHNLPEHGEHRHVILGKMINY
jgi:hypothetical protein